MDELDEEYYHDQIIDLLRSYEDRKEEKQKQEGLDIYYVNLAIKEGKSSICGRISDQNMKNACYSNIAASKKDSSICNMISNPDVRKSCIAGIP